MRIIYKAVAATGFMLSVAGISPALAQSSTTSPTAAPSNNGSLGSQVIP